jgi:hypothetical protein
MMTGGSLMAPLLSVLVPVLVLLPLGTALGSSVSRVSFERENSLLVFLPTILLLLVAVAVSLPVVAPSVVVFPDDDRGRSRSRRPGCRNLDNCRDGVVAVCGC